MTESPCVGMCGLGENGRCFGCNRKIEDIQKWKTMSEEEKQKVLEELEKYR